MRRAVILATALFVSAPMLASELWLHVRAEEHNGRRSRVVVNLPVKAFEKALPLIPSRLSHSCELRLRELDVESAEIRSIVEQLRTAPAGAGVRITREDGDIVARKEGTMLVISRSGSEWVRPDTISVSFDIAESLFGNGEIDFRAAVELLVRRGEGEIAIVQSDDSTVRIWVDRFAVAPLRNTLVSAVVE